MLDATDLPPNYELVVRPLRFILRYRHFALWNESQSCDEFTRFAIPRLGVIEK